MECARGGNPEIERASPKADSDLPRGLTLRAQCRELLYQSSEDLLVARPSERLSVCWLRSSRRTARLSRIALASLAYVADALGQRHFPVRLISVPVSEF